MVALKLNPGDLFQVQKNGKILFEVMLFVEERPLGSNDLDYYFLIGEDLFPFSESFFQEWIQKGYAVRIYRGGTKNHD